MKGSAVIEGSLGKAEVACEHGKGCGASLTVTPPFLPPLKFKTGTLGKSAQTSRWGDKIDFYAEVASLNPYAVLMTPNGRFT